MIEISPELRGPMKPGNPHGPLDELRQRRRALLLNLRNLDWSYRKIARELGISEESVRRGIQKAGAPA